MVLDYQITPKATTITKVIAKKKGFTIKWMKQSAEVTGEEYKELK